MSESSAELDELRRRIDEQSQRIEGSQDALRSSFGRKSLTWPSRPSTVSPGGEGLL